MRIVFGRVPILIAIVSLTGYLLACYGQTESPSFALTIALPNATAKVDSTIRLNATLQNEIDRVLFLPSIRFGGRQSGIVVRNRDGNRMPYKDDPAPDSIQKLPGAGLGVGPRKKAVESVNLRRYFDFSVPGEYFVQIVRTDPLTHLEVSSNSLTLTITPQ